MAEACPQCQTLVDDKNAAVGALLRCDRCGTRFAKPRPRAQADTKMWSVRDDDGGLGIHPALARKYGRNSIPDDAAVVDSGPVPRPPEPDVRHARPLPHPDALAPSMPAAPPRPASVAQPVPIPRTPTPIAQPAQVLMPPRPTPLAQPGVGQRPAPVPAPTAQAPLSPPRAEFDSETSPGRSTRREPERVPHAPVPDASPRIPGYQLTALVGKGAMGSVFRARHLASGKSAAIKILAPELAARPDFIARFEREGAAMRAVDHPGVVVVIDQGAALQPDGSDAHYIAMEFIEGVPLRNCLEANGRGQPMPPDVALRFARKIVQALGAAHARGVIHRDLKPENILVLGDDGEERLVLVDFGLAGILDEENDPHPNLTKSRMTMGTVNYMAPEQRTDAKRVDQRADLYAAGVIFYELLTGDLPLGRFALPTERGATVPVSVDKCIVRALARNPDERYQYAGQLDSDLEEIEREVVVSSGRVTVPARPRTDPGAARHTRDPVNRSAAPETVFTSGAMVLSHPGLTAIPLASPSLLRRAVQSLALPAVVVGVLVGILLLRAGCAG